MHEQFTDHFTPGTTVRVTEQHRNERFYRYNSTFKPYTNPESDALMPLPQPQVTQNNSTAMEFTGLNWNERKIGS